jgi:hypothetical protein
VLEAIKQNGDAGWRLGQSLAYTAFCENSQDQTPGTPASKGDRGFKRLTSLLPCCG